MGQMRHAASTPQQKRLSEMGFEIADLLANCRARDVRLRISATAANTRSALRGGSLDHSKRFTF